MMTETGDYHRFELADARIGGPAVSLPSGQMVKRRQALDTADVRGLSPVNVVRQARTWSEKKQRWADAVATGAEGVMGRRRDGTYVPGDRVDHTLKVKWVKSGQVVVLERRTSPNSAVLGAHNEHGQLVRVGGCSMVGKPEVQVDDLIEVNYLFSNGDSIYELG